MLAEIIHILILVLVVAAVFWLVVWVLEKAGIPLPAIVVRIAGVIVFLLALLWILDSGLVHVSAS
jgi:hypothetical protein